MFFFECDGAHRDLPVLTHSFPTRRSSDLQERRCRLQCRRRDRVRFEGGGGIRGMSSESTVRGGRPADLSLIETIRWEPGKGFLRLDHHMRRLKCSADALGFLQPDDPKAALQGAVTGELPLRVRLTVTYRGKIELTTSSFEPVPDDRIWRLRIAQQRLASDDAFLRHKTSRREAYEAARAEFSSEDADEVLLLNERGEVRSEEHTSELQSLMRISYAVFCLK